MKTIKVFLITIACWCLFACSDKPKDAVKEHIQNMKVVSQGLHGKAASDIFYEELSFYNKNSVFPNGKDNPPILSGKLAAYIVMFATDYPDYRYELSRSEKDSNRAIVLAKFFSKDKKLWDIKYMLLKEESGWKIDFSAVNWTGM